MRKLASIQKVERIFPIENCDAIEGIQILGWELVAKKGEFKENDLCVFFEIDSVLPQKEEFEFMRDKKFRVKTIKLRGQISQGLALPLSGITYADLTTFNVEDDVTDLLSVIKYEPPDPKESGGLNCGKRAGNFPEFLHKTDEVRIQSSPSILRRFQNEKFYVTEKVDGSSATFYLHEGKFGVCSRNFDTKEDEKSSFWQAARALDIEKKMRSLGDNIAFQGELIGPGVQKNKYKYDHYDVKFFNIFDIEKQEYYDYDNLCSTMEWVSLDTVPMLSVITLNHTVPELVEMSTDRSRLYDTMREGLVIRSLKLYHGRPISFKVISPKFLLKHGE